MRAWPSRLSALAAAVSLALTVATASPSLAPDAAPPSTAVDALVTRFDAMVAAAWEEQGLVAATPLDDSTWLRRLSLDLRGCAPTPAEIARFLARPAATRRAEEIEAQLTDPRFADELSFQWNELLVGEAGKDAEKTTRWLRPWLAERFREGITFPQLTTELIAASGAARTPGAFAFPISFRDSIETLAGVSARAFLGLQIQCAQCHDHPYDHWTREQFNRFVGFFVEMRGDHGLLSEIGGPGFRVIDRSPEWDLADRLRELEAGASSMDKPSMRAGAEGPAQRRTPAELAAVAQLRALLRESVGGERPILAFLADGEALESLRGRLPGDARDLLDRYLERREKFGVAAHLDDAPYEAQRGQSRRAALAEWIIAPGNRWFTLAQSNRIVSLLLGHGLVDPVDDLADGSDRILPELHAALAAALAEQGGDVRLLYRVVARTRAYALGAASGADSEARARSERWFAAHPRRSFTPEQLANTVLRLGNADIAAEHLDEQRAQLLRELERCSPGRADANDRTLEVNIPLALLLRNGDAAVIPAALRDDASLHALFDARHSEVERITPWFLATLSRPPQPEEARALVAALDAAHPRASADDLYWALVNSAEFHTNP